MVISIPDDVKECVSEIVERHGNQRDSLLPILVDINSKFGHISMDSLVQVSKLTDIPVGEIHGVISFYSFLSLEKRGKYIIRLCKTITCDMADKDRIVRVIEKELNTKFGETSANGMFTLEFTNCIGMCDTPPAMLINDKAYGGLTPEKVVDILESYKKGVIV